MALLTVTFCEFLCFLSGVAEVSTLLGYHSSLLGRWFQTFQNVISTLSRNVRSQGSRDAVSLRIRTGTSTKQLILKRTSRV